MMVLGAVPVLGAYGSPQTVKSGKVTFSGREQTGALPGEPVRGVR